MDSSNSRTISRREDETIDNSRNTLFTKCIMKTITHPLDYARFLVQVSNKQYLRDLISEPFYFENLLMKQ